MACERKISWSVFRVLQNVESQFLEYEGINYQKFGWAEEMIIWSRQGRINPI